MPVTYIPLDELSEYPELEKVMLEDQQPQGDQWAFEYLQLQEKRRQKALLH
jgi:hypothetical protein